MLANLEDQSHTTRVAALNTSESEEFLPASPVPLQIAKVYDYLSKEHVHIPKVSIRPPGLSWDAFHQNGTIHEGSISPTLKAKLLLQESLEIMVIGGSVSCGSKLSTSKKHLMRYGALFQEMLNAVMKPKRGFHRHSVTVECESGATTEEWAERITSGQMTRITRRLSLVDLVVIDTSVNDIGEIENGYHTRRKFQEQMELLLYALNSFPHLNVVILGTSTRHGPWQGRLPRGDSLRDFVTLCEKDGVTLLSVIDGLGPLASKPAQLWWLYVFTSGGWRAAETQELGVMRAQGSDKEKAMVLRGELNFPSGDNTHPSVVGHLLIADLLTNYLITLAKGLSDGGEEGGGLQPPRGPHSSKKPLYWETYDQLDEAVQTRPITIDLVHSQAGHTSAGQSLRMDDTFFAGEDVKGRAGLLSATWGSTLSLDINSTGTRELHHWILHLDVLKSYEHMSCLNVTYTLSGGQCSSLPRTKIFSTLWTVPYSEHATLSLQFNTNMTCFGPMTGDAKTTTTAQELSKLGVSPALSVIVQNTQCDGGAGEKKIKLFYLALY